MITWARDMFGFRRYWIYVAVLGAVSVYLSYFGTQYMLDRALRREAHSSGMDWLHHIENKLQTLDGMTLPDGRPDPVGLPDAGAFRQLLSDVFAVGHIYQFDYINTECLCHISLVSTADHSGRAHDYPHQFHTVHDHAFLPHGGRVSRAKGSLSSAQLGHVIHNTEAHPIREIEMGEASYLPIDRRIVREIVARNSDSIVIERGDVEGQPSTFASVYHLSSRGEGPKYLLRVLVNLEEQASRYSQFILLASGSSFLVLILAVGYPTRWYVLSARRQQIADQRAKYLANHDILTDLRNRNNFQEAVSDLLWTCREAGHSALMFVFDLNGFKEVNDYYGHHVGDRLLCAFADLLKAQAPEDAYIARLGGDEFVVLISGIEGPVQPHQSYLQLPRSVTLELNQGRQIVEAGIAGGVVQFPRDATTTAELSRMADLALYEAKPNRQGEIREYKPWMKQVFQERLDLRQEFRRALEEKHVEPYYQPIVEMETGKIHGFEALARWIHPQKGLLTPAVFETLFDDGEIGALLGSLMLEKITDDMARWTQDNVPFGTVGLNVVSGDLKRKTFAQDVLDELGRHGLAPDRLAIEVTENCFFGADKEAFLQHLIALRDAGCYIALDDFGTGYSSVTQLKELPFHIVKVDKTFVVNILDDPDDEAIVRALKQLGVSMGFKLILEGIESKEQLIFLRRIGFDFAQGYYFGRPMPAAKVPLFLRQHGDDGSVLSRDALAG